MYNWTASVAVFFLRNEAIRNQSHGSNSMSHGLVLQRNALVFEISDPVCISGMLEAQNVASRAALCLQDYPQGLFELSLIYVSSVAVLAYPVS